jgi:hypothetical protein
MILRLETDQNVRLGIGEGQLRALPEGLIFAVDPVVLANVFLETPGILSALFPPPSLIQQHVRG